MAFPWAALLIAGGTFYGVQSAREEAERQEGAVRLQQINDEIGILRNEREAENEYLRQQATLQAYYAASGGGRGPLNAANSALSYRLNNALDEADYRRTVSQTGASASFENIKAQRDGAIARTLFSAGAGLSDAGYFDGDSGDSGSSGASGSKDGKGLSLSALFRG